MIGYHLFTDSPIEESYDESVDESTQVRVTNKSYGAANVPSQLFYVSVMNVFQ